MADRNHDNGRKSGRRGRNPEGRADRRPDRHHGRRHELPPGEGGGAGSGAAWLYGVHTVMAALANPARDCRQVLAADPRLAEALREVGRPLGRDGLVETVAREAVEALLPPGAVHQGAALAAAPLHEPSLEDALAEMPPSPSAPVLVLDHVTDPRNIGAILRSAAAFGARAVVVQDRHAPPVTGALAKAASGGLERVALVRETNLARTIRRLQEAGYWCIGLDGDAPRSLAEAVVAGPMAVVLGAEGRGLRRLVGETCDALARIPQTDAVESLNVSNAAAIALYEMTRPR